MAVASAADGDVAQLVAEMRNEALLAQQRTEAQQQRTEAQLTQMNKRIEDVMAQLSKIQK